MKLFTFKPILKQTLWGGNKIASLKHIETSADRIGESWEISAVKGSESVVAEGDYEGLTIIALAEKLKENLLGKENYERFGGEFPLLIKFIDARDQLSIQVHPDDETARSQGKQRGKTEMWYVMPSDPDASLLCGLKKKITPAEYEQLVNDDTIVDAIARYDVKEGDCFYIPAGRIHSISKGCLLAEIQQTSDLTYRIYDFNRRDKDGNLRELHTKEAAESIDYRVLPDYRQAYTPKKNEGQTLVECPYFNTAVYDLNEPMQIDYSELDSFVILIGLKGEGRLNIDGEEVSFGKGETILLPAYINNVRAEGTVKFLETFVG